MIYVLAASVGLNVALALALFMNSQQEEAIPFKEVATASLCFVTVAVAIAFLWVYQI